MLFIREKPPLAHSHRLVTPSGKEYRWAEDEVDPSRVPSNVRHSDTMPGGFDTYDGTLPRKREIVYSDIERLSTIQVLDASCEIVGEYRLKAAPEVSGDQMSVTPSAEGWFAHLDDDKAAKMIYRDIDLSRWNPPSARLRAQRLASFSLSDPATAPAGGGVAKLRTAVTGAWATSPGRPMSESWYDANGIPIGSVYYDPDPNPNVSAADANWQAEVRLANDDLGSAIDTSGDLQPSSFPAGTVAATTTDRVYAAVLWFYGNVVGGGDNVEYGIDWFLAVRGAHGLPLQGVEPNAGYLASDIVRHAAQKWAPLLNIKSDSIQPSRFVIGQLAPVDSTTAGEIIKSASRFGLQDYAVWGNRELVWHNRGERGKRWRTRIGPAQFTQSGQAIDRLWESIIVQFSDVDGSTRTVGPPGSRTTVETADLKDSDPDNPANKLGMVRRDLLQMGTATVGEATEVGRRFLEESRLLDRSGTAQIVGWCEDDHGVWFPFSWVRAGDYMSFIDAHDPSPRRIISTEKDHSTKTCSVTLDAPPQGLAALLERLGVILVPLGLS